MLRKYTDNVGLVITPSARQHDISGKRKETPRTRTALSRATPKRPKEETQNHNNSPNGRQKTAHNDSKPRGKGARPKTPRKGNSNQTTSRHPAAKRTPTPDQQQQNHQNTPRKNNSEERANANDEREAGSP